MTQIIVLGAGMVGVSTALALQARGHDVALVDRRGPGEETSYGNAGIIQSEAVEPYPFPLAAGSLLAIAGKRGNDVDWGFSGLRHWLEPALRYAYHSLPRRYGAIAARYARMIRSATADHAPLIAASGAGALISREGFRKAYRTERALAVALAEAERLRTAFGVPSAALDGGALGAAEPGLLIEMAGAVHWTDAWSCRDPGGLVRRYADLFAAGGGEIVKGDAGTLARDGVGWRVATEAGAVAAAHAVVALGVWSPDLLKRFGHRFPMVFKRGYHRHFAVAEGPRLPIMDVETATFLSPMTQGLRVLTGAELNAPDAPAGSRQIERSIAAAGELFALGAPREPAPWLGTRPCMPDMLPVVGPSNRHDGLWFNFGHGHQGFTLGPTTGRMLADALDRKVAGNQG